MISPDQVNQWRIIPRVLVGWYSLLVWRVTDWFMLLDAPTTEHTIFVSTVIGMSAAIFGLYVNSGNKND